MFAYFLEPTWSIYDYTMSTPGSWMNSEHVSSLITSRAVGLAELRITVSISNRPRPVHSFESFILNVV